MILPAIFGAVLLTASSVYMMKNYSENEEDRYSSVVAKDVVDNAGYLQRISMEDGETNRNMLIKRYEIPIRTMVVKDGSISNEELNAFTKQYKATIKLLENNPNIEDADITCTLLTGTNEINTEECELIKNKQFKMYSFKDNSVSYELSEANQKILNYTKEIQFNQMDASIADGNLTVDSLIEINGAMYKNEKQLKRLYAIEKRDRKEIEDLLLIGDAVGASAKLKKFTLKCKDDEVIEQLVKRTARVINNKKAEVAAEEALHISSGSTSTEKEIQIESEKEKLEIANSNIVSTLSDVGEMVFVTNKHLTLKQNLVSDPAIQEIVNSDISTNNYINNVVKTNYNKFY